MPKKKAKPVKKKEIIEKENMKSEIIGTVEPVVIESPKSETIEIKKKTYQCTCGESADEVRIGEYKCMCGKGYAVS